MKIPDKLDKTRRLVELLRQLGRLLERIRELLIIIRDGWWPFRFDLI